MIIIKGGDGKIKKIYFFGGVIDLTTSGSVAWGEITGTLSDQTDLQNVLNSLSTATSLVQTNLTSHTSNTSNPHVVTKSQVGLSNVDNTSDVNKPVSTAQAAADAVVLSSAQAYANGLVYYKPLFDHFTDVGNSTTAETDLYSDTILANQLSANGQELEAEYGGLFVSSGTATRRIKIYFGGSSIFDTGALTLSLSAAWTVYLSIIRVSSTVIRYMISLTTEGAALSAYTATGEVTGLTLSSTNILKITGQAAGIGAASNDIVAKMGKVSWIAAS